MTPGVLPVEVRRWCDGLVDIAGVEELPTRRPGHVFAMTGSDGEAVLKVASDADAFMAEVHAYESWAPRMAGACARLVAASPSLRALLLTRLPGRPVADPTSTVCAAAGRALACLQAAVPARPCSSDAFALNLEHEMRVWHRRGDQILAAGELAVAVRAIAGLDREAPIDLVACHGDFLPHNWLIDDHGESFAMVDFEHSRYDAPEMDLAVLWDGALAQRPGLRAALLRAYGGLDELGQLRLNALRAVVALARVVGGSRAVDGRVERAGRQGLHSLTEELEQGSCLASRAAQVQAS